MRMWRPTAILLISLTLLSVGGTLSFVPQSAAAQGVSLSGWLHVIWADPPSGSQGEPGPRYVLIDEQDRWTEVVLDEDHVGPLGGPLAFNRKRVTITGEWEEGLPGGRGGGFAPRRRLRVDVIRAAQGAGAPAAPFAAAPLAVTGSQPWVTILCRFADSATVTPRPKSYFDTLLTGVYPGLDHYWREVSYDNVNIAGSVVVGWYNLPRPRSYYVHDQNGDGQVDLDFQRAKNDCTAAADADVFFPNFVGINLMFNQSLDCCAWGGSTTLTRDGQTRSYRITWEPPWGYANQDVIGHEMGHGFGLPHSSGPYNATYDSQWDVMSAGGRCSPPDAVYGCVGVHTISYHKDFLGWIPTARKFVPAPGSSQTIVLERLGQPMFSSNYLMAQIPIGNSTTQFYTVEARRFPGYDNQIPGEAVVIHKVDTTRSDRLAQVVDSDNNGNPNDAGARWTPGETFTDSANGIAVTVNAATTAGFSVTVGYGGAGTAPNVGFQDNMENGSGGWLATGSWGQTTTASHSLTHSWTDSPAGNYANNQFTALFSPTINLTGLNSAILTFWHRFDFGSGDAGYVLVNSNGNWGFVGAFSGSNPSWHQEAISLSAFAGQSVVVAFLFTSDASGTADGWYIDDVSVGP